VSASLPSLHAPGSKYRSLVNNVNNVLLCVIGYLKIHYNECGVSSEGEGCEKLTVSENFLNVVNGVFYIISTEKVAKSSINSLHLRVFHFSSRVYFSFISMQLFYGMHS
jgi:hypothetical protein